MEQTVVGKFTPRKWQYDAFKNLKRFSVLVLHRRAGKTVLSTNVLISKALQKPKGVYAYIAPTFSQCEKIAWNMLKEYAGHIPNMKWHNSKLICEFPNGAVIYLMSGDNPDSLRGLGFDGVVIDEVADMPAVLWDQVVRPALADKNGWALFIGTPKGTDQFYEKYQFGLDIDKPEWHSIKMDYKQTGALKETEIVSLRSSMSDESWEQEMLCSFEPSNEASYYSKYLKRARDSGRISNDIQYDERLPVHTAWDIGISDKTAVWFFQLKENGNICCIDYEEEAGLGLIEWKDVLDNKPYRYGSHIAPHDIEERSKHNGITLRESAYDIGLDFDIKAAKIKVQAGIEEVRVNFSRFYFNSVECEKGIQCLGMYRAAVDKKDPENYKAAPVHDKYSHGADSFRYLCVALDEVENDFYMNTYSNKIGRTHFAKTDWNVLG